MPELWIRKANPEGLIDWSIGLNESVFLSVFSFIFLFSYIILARPEIFQYTPAVFYYMLLLIMGIITNAFFIRELDLNANTFKQGLGYGIIGFFVLLIPGIIISVTGFRLLTIPIESPIYLLFLERWYEYLLGQLSPLENFAIQLTFVAFGEELLFRNSVPMMVDIVLRRSGVSKGKSLAVGFGVSTLLFGSLHFFAYGGNPIQLSTAFIAGGILAIFRFFGSNNPKKLKGGLWTTVVAHLLYNVTSLVGVFTITERVGQQVYVF